MPHGHCYLWNPALMGTMVATDGAIAVAYFCIAGFLYRLARGAGLPQSGMILSFGTFIAACGLTHVMEIVTLWVPLYWLAALIKAVTAVASVLTLLYLVRARPQIAKVASYANSLGTKLAETEFRLRSIADNIPALIAYIDAESRVQFANLTYENWFGLKREQILGKRTFEVFGKAAEERRNWLARALAGEEVRFRDTLTLLNGTVLFTDSHYVPDRDQATGEVRGAFTFSADVTELEQHVRDRTAELRAANHELETFSYSVSHDLRAPLRAILGFGQAMLEDSGSALDAQARAHLDRILAAGRRMGELVDGLLELSRLSRRDIHRETVDLSKLASEVADEIQATEGRSGARIVVDPGLEVLGDQALLRVVMQNLLRNAWKFTSKTKNAEVRFSRVEVEGQPAFVVRDNGVGFDMAYVDKLFGAFQRLHGVNEFPGTGIGLATVQRIISRHGGKIWAEGKLGEGASFYFTL